MDDKSGKHVGNICAVFSIIVWALFATIIAFSGEINPFLFLAITYFVGFGVLFLKCLINKQNFFGDLKRIPKRFIFLVVIGIGVHDLTWILAVQNAPAEEAALVIYQWPMLIVIFTAILLRKRLLWSQVAGCFLGMTGLFILLGSDLTYDLKSGHLYALVSSLTWSLYSAVSARHSDISSNILGGNFLVTGLLCILIWLCFYDAVLPSLSVLLVVGVYSIFQALAYILWDFSMKNGDAPFIAIMSFLTPALSVLFLVIFGVSLFSPKLLFALAVIMAGIMLAKFIKV